MRRLLAALLGLLVTASWAAPGDEAFMEARDAAQRNRMDLVARQVPELRAHPLLPYVEQWLLRARLSELPQDEVEDFLGRYQGQLVANRLRAEWLRTLGRRKFWTAFDKDWPALVDPDTLSCSAASPAGPIYRVRDLVGFLLNRLRGGNVLRRARLAHAKRHQPFMIRAARSRMRGYLPSNKIPRASTDPTHPPPYAPHQMRVPDVRSTTTGAS